MEEQRHYVGIDLHRRRSVLVRMAGDGTVLDTVWIENDPIALAADLAKAGPEPEVAMEATLGWYWAADVVGECGANLHLAHPLPDQGLRLPAGEEGRVRRPPAGRPVAHGAPPRGLGRPAGDPRAA